MITPLGISTWNMVRREAGGRTVLKQNTARWSGVLGIVIAVLAGLASTARAGYVTHLLSDPDLIAYYRLNETTGAVAVEESGNTANNGQYVGSIPGDNMAGPGPADGFSGLGPAHTAPNFSDDSVLLPDGPFDRAVVTISGFLKNAYHTGYWRRLYATDDTSTHKLNVAVYQDDMMINTGAPYGTGASRRMNSVAEFADDQWHHFVLVRNGDDVANVEFFVDGKRLSKTSSSSDMGYEDGIRIGNRGTSTLYDWIGGIDEVAFFGRAFGAHDVARLYYQATQPGLPEPFAAEPFTYGTAGSSVELNGQNGGTGFSGAWTADTAVTEVVDPGTPLSYDPAAGPIGGGHRALRLNRPGTSAYEAERMLATPESGDVYVSFLLRWDEGTVGANDFVSLFFDDTAGPSIGVKGNQASSSGTKDFYTRLTSGGTVAYSGNIGDNTTTHLVVGRLFKDGSTNYNSFSLWADPLWTDEANPDVTATGDAGFASFSRIGLNVWNLDSDDVILVDQLRFGRAWKDVVFGVPEPATSSLLLLGLLTAGFAVSLRRRKSIPADLPPFMH